MCRFFLSMTLVEGRDEDGWSKHDEHHLTHSLLLAAAILPTRRQMRTESTAAAALVIVIDEISSEKETGDVAKQLHP